MDEQNHDVAIICDIIMQRTIKMLVETIADITQQQVTPELHNSIVTMIGQYILQTDTPENYVPTEILQTIVYEAHGTDINSLPSF